jgi:hypothetical protein
MDGMADAEFLSRLAEVEAADDDAVLDSGRRLSRASPSR